MAIIELYSKRQKRLRGDVPDVYTYDEIPQNLRVQIIHICNGTIGSKEECSRRDDIYQAYMCARKRLSTVLHSRSPFCISVM